MQFLGSILNCKHTQHDLHLHFSSLSLTPLLNFHSSEYALGDDILMRWRQQCRATKTRLIFRDGVFRLYIRILYTPGTVCWEYNIKQLSTLWKWTSLHEIFGPSWTKPVLILFYTLMIFIATRHLLLISKYWSGRVGFRLIWSPIGHELRCWGGLLDGLNSYNNLLSTCCAGKWQWSYEAAEMPCLLPVRPTSTQSMGPKPIWSRLWIFTPFSIYLYPQFNKNRWPFLKGRVSFFYFLKLKYECIEAFIQLCSKYSSRTSSYALLFSMKCFGFAPLIRRVNEHFVWHPLLQLYIAIMCGKWPGVWFQACKWALYVFVHSTHLLFVFKMTVFTDQFISTIKINCHCFHALLAVYRHDWLYNRTTK